MAAFLSLTASARPLQHKVALVTGGARRIGRSIAIALADAGADVAITYNRSSEDAADTLALLRQNGVRAEGFMCDLHLPTQITETVRNITAWAADSGHSALDIVVNNAGAFASAELEALTSEQWDTMFEVNTRAPMLVAQAALPWLRKASGTGRLIHIGSLGGNLPWTTHAHYCASKAALHMLTKTMAKAWAPQVAVNCVAPGMIVSGKDAGAGYEHFVKKTPMERNGRPEDIAEVVLYLAIATPFLTGQILTVDGGLGLSS